METEDTFIVMPEDWAERVRIILRENGLPAEGIEVTTARICEIISEWGHFTACVEAESSRYS